MTTRPPIACRAPVHATAGDERGATVAWLLDRAASWHRLAEAASDDDLTMAAAARRACANECIEIAKALACGAHESG